MKIIALFIVGLVCLIPTLSFGDVCPSPDSIHISDNFKVTAPSGWNAIFAPSQTPITQPIAFQQVTFKKTDGTILPQDGPYKNVTVDYLFCQYCVGSGCAGGRVSLSINKKYSVDVNSHWHLGVAPVPVIGEGIFCVDGLSSCEWFSK